MRHAKRTFKIGRTASHRRCLIANQLKSLVAHGRIETTVTKAKELRRHADRLVTCAKKGTLAAQRQIIAKLMISYNSLTTKEQRAVKQGDTSAYNTDRVVVKKLLEEVTPRFKDRQGGYTRIVRMQNRAGDSAETCIIEFVQ